MQLEDAIESAIEEFKSQGVDLSGIYTSSGLQNHHVYQISTRMNQSLRSGDLSSLGHTVTSLEEQVDAIIIEGRDTVAFTEIIPVLLSSKTIACFGAGVEALQDDHEVLARFLTLYSKILPLSLDLREEFRVGNYMDAIPFDHSSVHVKCAALSVAGSLAANDESGKGVVMSKNPQKYILEVLELAKEMDHLEAAVESTSALIVPLASADDLTQPSSRYACMLLYFSSYVTSDDRKHLKCINLLQCIFKRKIVGPRWSCHLSSCNPKDALQRHHQGKQ